MKNLAEYGLTFQVAGIALALFGFTHLHVIQTGVVIHFIGDVLFFLQMKRQGCI